MGKQEKGRFQKIVFKNTSFQLLGRGVIIIFGLITTSLLTRKLGPNLYGDYVFLNTFFLFLVTLSDWGTPFVGIRELSKAKTQGQKNLVFSNLVILRFLLLLITLSLGLILIITLPLFSSLRSLAFLFLLALIFTNFQVSLTTLFQSFLRFDWQALIQVSNAGLFFLFLIPIFFLPNFFLPPRLIGIIWALIIARFLSFLLAFFKGKKLGVSFVKKSKKTIGYLWKEALPTGGLLFLSTIYDRLIDASFLKSFWGSSAVGVYGLSYKLYGNLVLPAYFLSRALFPFLSQSKKKGKSQAAFKLGITWSLLGALVVVILSWVFSPLAIKILGGELFASSVIFLRILSLSLPFTYLNHIFGFSLIAQGRQVLSFKIGLFSLFWNLALNSFLIPRFGSLGAAWVTVSTEALVCLLSFLFLRKERSAWYTKTHEERQ